MIVNINTGMEEDSTLITLYGLEFPARALAPQSAETEVVRFLVGTQSLKMSNNQVHLVELNEETGALSPKIFQHGEGEIWSLAASPVDPEVISTCYNTVNAEGDCVMKSAIWRLPEQPQTSTEGIQSLQMMSELKIEGPVEQIKVSTFNPSDGNQVATVVDNRFLVWDIAEANAKLVSTRSMEGRGHHKFTIGKWNSQHSGPQFATANDTSVRGWDLRTKSKQAWAIENAHSQLVRDLDFNPNRQYYLGTCGDDATCKFWDVRKPTEAILTRSDHSHWVWCLRYNHFHDQLVVSASSDNVVLLTSVASIASDPLDNETEVPKTKISDGLLATYDQHEDSVYCVEWSAADPWCFASLSYDGRLLLNRVPKAHKFKLLL